MACGSHLNGNGSVRSRNGGKAVRTEGTSSGPKPTAIRSGPRRAEAGRGVERTAGGPFAGSVRSANTRLAAELDLEPRDPRAMER